MTVSVEAYACEEKYCGVEPEDSKINLLRPEQGQWLIEEAKGCNVNRQAAIMPKVSSIDDQSMVDGIRLFVLWSCQVLCSK